MNTRKIITILIVVLLVAGVGYGVWSMFLRTPKEVSTPNDSGLPSAATATPGTSTAYPGRLESTTSTPAPDAATSPGNGVLPQPTTKDATDSFADVEPGQDSQAQKATTLKLKSISEGEVVGATLTRDGEFVKYYRKRDGFVFKIGFEGEGKEVISDTKISNLEEVNWSPVKDEVIITKMVDNKTIKAYYNYNNGDYSKLDPRMKKISWSPSGKKIVYHFIDPAGQSNISLANPDGSGWYSLEPNSIYETKIHWPSTHYLSLVTPGGELYPSAVYRLPLTESEEKKLLEGVDLEAGLEWSEGGDMFVFKKEDQDGLYLYSLGGNSVEDLKIKALPSKCVWAESGESIFCAMASENIIDQGLLPEDYAKSLLPDSDSFWEIDLSAKKVKELYMPKSKENVINVKRDSLMVSPNEKYLLWEDAGDGKLYSLRL